MADISTVTMPDGSVKDIKDSISRSSVSELVDSGAKNRVPLSFVSTSADITVGYSNNKLIINGSSTSAQSVYSNIYLDSGTYMLTGCPTGGGTDSYQCELRTSTQGSMGVADTGNGKQFTLTTAGNYRYNVRIAANYTASNLEISPMICTKAAWDASHEYEPYAKTNPELTADGAEDRDALVELVDSGAKNILEFDYISGGTATGGGTTWSSNGVTFTLNTDNTITVNRVSSSESNAVCQLYLDSSKIYIDSLCDNSHVLSGCPDGGSDTTFLIGAYRGSYAMKDIGEGAVLLPTTQANVYLQITIMATYSPNNLVFKPMICTKAAWDISHAYQPYRPSEDEQNAQIALNKTNISKNAAELIELVNGGAKNIADGRRTDTTTGGVEFTFAADGTFTANGTAADHKATSAIMISICNFTPKTGVEYVLSGSPTNGSPTTYALRVATANDETIAWDTGTGVSFTAASNNALTIKCSIKSGTVVNNMRFAPMICTKAAWDISQAYVPYCPTMAELYAMIQAQT